MAKSSSKPNILVIWGDDMGVHNVRAYNHGVMGYRTPNIDLIAQVRRSFIPLLIDPRRSPC